MLFKIPNSEFWAVLLYPCLRLSLQKFRFWNWKREKLYVLTTFLKEHSILYMLYIGLTKGMIIVWYIYIYNLWYYCNYKSVNCMFSYVVCAPTIIYHIRANNYNNDKIDSKKKKIIFNNLFKYLLTKIYRFAIDIHVHWIRIIRDMYFYNLNTPKYEGKSIFYKIYFNS